MFVLNSERVFVYLVLNSERVLTASVLNSERVIDTFVPVNKSSAPPIR